VEDELAMTQTRINTCRTVVLGVALALSVVACGKSAADAPAAGAAFATQPPKSAPPTTLPIGAECSVEALKAGAATKYPDSGLGEFKCTSTFAIAAIFPKGGAKAGLAGFFTASNNAWVLAADTAANGDVAAAAPPDFPADLVKDWQNAYVDPTKATTTTAPSSGGGSGSGSGCNSDVPERCTTLPPQASTTTTTTTSRSTTTTTKSSPSSSSPTTSRPNAPTSTARGGGLG
jgi:hypothetical protein